MPISDEDLEWIVRVALESRRRVKEQQRRVFKSEFRNTHFSYILGPEGVEQFVSTPELHSDEAIESDPLPPGQVWGVSLGAAETGPGLYRIEVTCGPGGGVKILNQPTPPAFRESVRVGEQNLYTRSKELVGDRNPREEEFSIQMRPMDADKTGAGLGVPVLVALCGGLLGRNTRGGTIVVGALNLGGSIEMIPNAVRIAELAIDKQAQTLLMPVSARRQLNDLPDDLWTKISIEFYKDAADAVFKALVECQTIRSPHQRRPACAYSSSSFQSAAWAIPSTTLPSQYQSAVTSICPSRHPSTHLTWNSRPKCLIARRTSRIGLPKLLQVFCSFHRRPGSCSRCSTPSSDHSGSAATSDSRKRRSAALRSRRSSRII